MNELIRKQDALNALNEQIEQCNKALSSFDISAKDKYAVEAERASLKAYREQLENLPSAQPERKAPMSYKEQLSLDCSFCRQHECGDTLYESANWDGGVGFDYIRNIRFCPICGRKLYSYEDVER